MNRLINLFFSAIIAMGLFACSNNEDVSVTIYTSHDRVLSEPVLKKFEKSTGIQVNAVYDVEANKTVGLVNRLLAEKESPVADVFWNNEVGRSVLLQSKGAFEAIQTDEQLKHLNRHTGKYWVEFAARVRVLAINTKKNDTESISSINDLLDPKWKGKAAFSNPHFGTTGTHFSAIYTQLGEQKFREWLVKLKQNSVQMLPGNGQVRDKVASGEITVGLTDTDDALSAVLDGKSIRVVFPDQSENQQGMFVIPNTVGKIKNAPHSKAANKLIDFLLSPEVESMLAKGRGFQIPILHDIEGPSNVPQLNKARHFQHSFATDTENYEKMLTVFRDVWGI